MAAEGLTAMPTIKPSHGGVRIDHVTTSGTFELDGGSWEVDNNVWVLGDERECRQQRERLEAVQEVRDRFRVDVQAVGDEQQVELRGFGLPRELAHEGHVDARVGDRIRMPPRGHVAGCALDDGAEMDRAG